MALRRGPWKVESVNKTAAVKSSRYGARPATIQKEGASNSEHYLASRAQVIDEKIPTEVSEFRRAELLRATTQSPGDSSNPTPLVVYSNSFKKSQEIKEHYLKKQAASVTSGGFSTAGGGTVIQAPEIYSPLFQMANLQLPRERITMNAWNRNFYETHPLVHNCINLHATYPINKINIKCKDGKIEQFFKEMAESIDLVGVLQAMALEIYKVGETFPYAELDEHRGVWKSIVIQNPDYVHIKTSVLGGEPIISLQPDAALKRMIQSNNPADIQLRSQIDEEILYHIRKGNNIPLNNFNVSHLALKSAPYDVHGTSPIVTVYKDLMLYDRLRESKFAQADSLINPITLVKIGGNADGEYRASGDDLEKWRQTMEAASYDKDFKIICHGGVEITRVGANGAIIDINPDIQAILDNILYGLMVPKAVVTQEGASFNSATVGLEVLKQRYESFRNMMAQWLIKKIFAPISEIQEFYEYKDGDKKLIVPEIEWNRMILFDMDNYINVLNGLVKEKAISKTTLFRSLGLNLDEENRLRKEELIQDAIYEKEKAILAGMTLGMLRSVSPEDDIIEPTESNALPGTPGSEDAGVPGMEPTGGGGLGGGGPLGGGLGGGAGPLGGPSGGGLGDIPAEGLGEPGSGSAAEPMGLETPPSPAPAAPTK